MERVIVTIAAGGGELYMLVFLLRDVDTLRWVAQHRQMPPQPPIVSTRYLRTLAIQLGLVGLALACLILLTAVDKNRLALSIATLATYLAMLTISRQINAVRSAVHQELIAVARAARSRPVGKTNGSSRNVTISLDTIRAGIRAARDRRYAYDSSAVLADHVTDQILADHLAELAEVEADKDDDE